MTGELKWFARFLLNYFIMHYEHIQPLLSLAKDKQESASVSLKCKSCEAISIGNFNSRKSAVSLADAFQLAGLGEFSQALLQADRVITV